MTTYKLIKAYRIEMDNKKTYGVEIYQVWEKFATVPFYESYIDGQQAICRYSKITTRDIINYIERYL